MHSFRDVFILFLIFSLLDNDDRSWLLDWNRADRWGAILLHISEVVGWREPASEFCFFFFFLFFFCMMSGFSTVTPLLESIFPSYLSDDYFVFWRVWFLS